MGVRPNSAARRPSATNFVRYVEREDCGVIGYTATRSTRAAATAQAAASFPSQTTNFDFGFSAALMQSPPILIASITFRLLPQARGSSSHKENTAASASVMRISRRARFARIRFCLARSAMPVKHAVRGPHHSAIERRHHDDDHAEHHLVGTRGTKIAYKEPPTLLRRRELCGDRDVLTVEKTTRR